MPKFQAEPIPPAQRFLLSSLTQNFRAAISYLSFYSADSPFVIQACQKLFNDFQKLLAAVGSFILYVEEERVHVNGTALLDAGDLAKVMEEKRCLAVQFTDGLTYAEWMGWLRKMTSHPSAPAPGNGKKPSQEESQHLLILSGEDTTPSPGGEPPPPLAGEKPGLKPSPAMPPLKITRTAAPESALPSVEKKTEPPPVEENPILETRSYPPPRRIPSTPSFSAVKPSVEKKEPLVPSEAFTPPPAAIPVKTTPPPSPVASKPTELPKAALSPAVPPPPPPPAPKTPPPSPEKRPVEEPVLPPVQVQLPLSEKAPPAMEKQAPPKAVSTDAPARARIQENDVLMDFLAEAWQFSRLLRKTTPSTPQSLELVSAFDRLFDRLLGHMAETSPELEKISNWFKKPEGNDDNPPEALFSLLEVAVQKDWTSVLLDPGTRELVGRCLAHWGANGRHELVEKTVFRLAEGLRGPTEEKQVALAHLADARPWIHQTGLLEKALEGLTSALAGETLAGLYQTELLLAWDLVVPALDASKEDPALALLSTLHFHCEEDASPFPERASIARHWLFEKSTPPLTLRLARCAHRAGQLDRYPLLGEVAAPLLLQGFLAASAGEAASYHELFRHLREPLQGALLQRLPELESETEIRQLFPVLKACGVDGAIGFQLSPWMAKGSRELKLDLIRLIEEIQDSAGGTSLRLALFDDSEEVAALAARALGEIRFMPAVSILERAFQVRKKRFGHEKAFLAAMCRTLGDLGQPSCVPFLVEIARKKSLLERGQTYSTAERLEAVQALVKINQPEAWTFMESLVGEKNRELDEALTRLINERTSL